jgi:hypothetical protein
MATALGSQPQIKLVSTIGSRRDHRQFKRSPWTAERPFRPSQRDAEVARRMRINSSIGGTDRQNTWGKRSVTVLLTTEPTQPGTTQPSAGTTESDGGTASVEPDPPELR